MYGRRRRWVQNRPTLGAIQADLGAIQASGTGKFSLALAMHAYIVQSTFISAPRREQAEEATRVCVAYVCLNAEGMPLPRVIISPFRWLLLFVFVIVFVVGCLTDHDPRALPGGPWTS